jgi:hypothetical protein
MKDKLQLVIKDLAKWLSAIFLHAGDVVFLIFGFICISIGAFIIYIPAGWITLGLCFLALAFFIGKKQVDIETQEVTMKRW